ncbi:MAG TPA: Holliday junction branch migration protein RuvA [Gemmatimonadales bacterium]|nr:Holliday junction branch migration protein RuvA [Gemmatimonadales bacterium]
MISAVRGTLISKTGDRVVLETGGGVSYEIAVPLGVLERLPAEGRGAELKTVLVVREDGWALYGFDQEVERTVFQRLLAASGIGPRLALALVSTLGGARVVAAVREGDVAALCAVPGIGKKTADRMVLELKDRLRDLALAEAVPSRGVPAEQAVQALMNLGYGPADADRAVRAVLSQDGTGEPADLIRRALQRLTERR